MFVPPSSSRAPTFSNKIRRWAKFAAWTVILKSCIWNVSVVAELNRWPGSIVEDVRWAASSRFRLRFAELNEDGDASMPPVFAIRVKVWFWRIHEGLGTLFCCTNLNSRHLTHPPKTIWGLCWLDFVAYHAKVGSNFCCPSRNILNFLQHHVIVRRPSENCNRHRQDWILHSQLYNH
jgi:hypothetical protein